MNYSNLLELKHDVWAVYGDEETQLKSKIFFAAVVDGEPMYLDVDSRGVFAPAKMEPNFIRFEWGKLHKTNA